MNNKEWLKKILNDKKARTILYIFIAVFAIIFVCELIIIIFGPVKDTGNIIGGVIGGFSTILGIYITLRYYRQKEEQLRKDNFNKVKPYISGIFLDEQEIRNYKGKKRTESIIISDEIAPVTHYLMIKNYGIGVATYFFVNYKSKYIDAEKGLAILGYAFYPEEEILIEVHIQSKDDEIEFIANYHNIYNDPIHNSIATIKTN